MPPPLYRKRAMPLVFDENGPVFIPYGELGTARSEPAPQPCDECGKVCEECSKASLMCFDDPEV